MLGFAATPSVSVTVTVTTVMGSGAVEELGSKPVVAKTPPSGDEVGVVEGVSETVGSVEETGNAGDVDESKSVAVNTPPCSPGVEKELDIVEVSVAEGESDSTDALEIVDEVVIADVAGKTFSIKNSLFSPSTLPRG